MTTQIAVPRLSHPTTETRCPTLSHTPMGHPLTCADATRSALSQNHPWDTTQTPRFSLQSRLSQLSPLRGRCASSPRPPHLPAKGPAQHEGEQAMTTTDHTPGHDNPTGREGVHARAHDTDRETLVPSTDEIRYRVEHDWEPYGAGSFDLWLAAHVAAAVAAERERAWDEGYEAGDPYHRRGDPAWSVNPYRIARTSTEGEG